MRASVSKRDYYEVLGVERQATRPADQERVPQAGAEVSSRPQPGQSAGRGTLQGSGRSLRVLADTREARPLRSLRPRRRHRRRRGAAGFDPTIFADFSDIFSGLGDVFGFGDIFGGRRRRGGPQRGADLRYDLEITFEESATRRRDDDPDSARGDLRDLHGIRRRARHDRRNLRAVPRLRSAALPAGLPHRRAAVSELPRHRQDDRQAVPELPRRRPHRPRAQADGQDPRGHRHRSAPAPLRRRRTRQRWRPCRRPLRRRARAGALVLPPRGGRPLLRAADSLSTRWRSAATSRCRRSTAARSCTSRPARSPARASSCAARACRTSRAAATATCT